MNATIRLSTSEDDSALVSLSARSPMQAPLSICIERSPSFFALRDLRGRLSGVGAGGCELGHQASCLWADRRVGRPVGRKSSGRRPSGRRAHR